jgi:5-methyltetrahydrofolate--homocysteine methyltransferase
LVIEIDGSSHDDIGTIVADEERDAWLDRNGYKVVRFTTQEIFTQLERVILEIEAAIDQPELPSLP